MMELKQPSTIQLYKPGQYSSSANNETNAEFLILYDPIFLIFSNIKCKYLRERNIYQRMLKLKDPTAERKKKMYFPFS